MVASFKCFECYDDSLDKFWRVEVHHITTKSDIVVKEISFTTQELKPNFDTMMGLLHGIYGCEMGEFITQDNTPNKKISLE